MAKPQQQHINGNGNGNGNGNPCRHFFKIMLSPKLILPEGFLKEFGDDLACVAKLRDPNEHVWEVGVEKCGEGVFFGDKWKEFLNYYSICHGHFIVFKYQGNSCFRVLVFDSSACEITYPIPSPTFGASLDHNKYTLNINGEGNNVDLSGNSREREMVDDELAIVTSCHQSNNGETNSADQMGNIDDQANERDTQSLQKANKKRKREQDMTGRKRRMCKSLGRDNVTQEQRLDAIRRARECMVRSQKPSFDVVMRTHHIQNPHVYVRRPFCNRYMNGPPGWVSLEVADGRHWRVSYTYNHGNNSGKSLRKGWAAFHRENSLEEGDVCVFELLNPDQPHLVFKVEIFRAVPLNEVGVPTLSKPDPSRPDSPVPQLLQPNPELSYEKTVSSDCGSSSLLGY